MNKINYKKIPLSFEIKNNWRVEDDMRTGLLDFVNFIKSKKVKSIVEIGSFLGDSTSIFASNFELVYSVDPYIPNYDMTDAASYMFDMFDVECNFLNRTKQFNNIIKIKMTGECASKLFENNSLDCVYIDSNHEYISTKTELIRWVCKIKNKGVMSGHDYNNPSHEGVKRAVDDIIGIPDIIFKDYSWAKIIS